MSLFDNFGRCNPLPDWQERVCGSHDECYVTQPMTSYLHLLWRHRRLKMFTMCGEDRFLSAAEFARRACSLNKQLRKSRKLSPLMQGVHLPICLPQLNTWQDYGRALSSMFFRAVQRSFIRTFKERQLFNNESSEPFYEQLAIVPESRHQYLFDRMKQGPVVGIYFPEAMQGFSVRAAREHMDHLPDNVLLGGGLDVATALVMYPDVLGRDDGRGHQRPWYILAALHLRPESEQCLRIINWDSVTAVDDGLDSKRCSAQNAPGLFVIEDSVH